MSLHLMVQIMEEADLTRPQQSILVAMAENTWDDGTHCFPSVDKIAWKAGYKPRNVVDIIRELRQMGVLEVVKQAAGRRATEYRIRVDQAPRKASFQDWQETHGRHADTTRRGAVSREVQNDEGCNLASLGVQSHGFETRENAPRTVIEPSEPIPPTPKTQTPVITIEDPVSSRTRKRRTDDPGFDRFWDIYPNEDDKKKARDAWKRLNPDDDLVEEIIAAVERQKLTKKWQDGYVRAAFRWLRDENWTDGGVKQVTPVGPPDVELLPGETAEETGPGEWTLHGANGRKRYVDPAYYGVVFDTRIHTHEGRAAFEAAVAKAKAEHERRSA